MKNQIKMFKQSSQSLLNSPQKSLEYMNSHQSLGYSPLVNTNNVNNSVVKKKQAKKVKKKIRRKKVDYLNPAAKIKVKIINSSQNL